ncbi:DNA-processing protein DprA [Brachybacterium tyrofermentans]|uniref:DNA-processing protein DprA n=1 Tax=Brachybacterium tyrofermentans TaxID=47848 RepID=UPI003FD4B896
MARLADQVRDERQARVVLSMIAEPDDPVTGRLLNQVSGVETLRLIEDDQAAVPGMNRVDAITWREHMSAAIPPDLAERMAQLQDGRFGTLIPADAHWPVALNELGDRAPYVLWTRGATSLLAGGIEGRATITGARATTPYGTTVAGELAAELANQDRVIVAGGAYGIEGAAHRATLAAGGSTVAVLAGGVDRPYPSGHADLLDRVGDLGLLVSEVPLGVAPSRHRFLARARLLAALSGTTVVPEAASRSMSLRVATEAHRLGRPVGAVPGPVTSAASTGPNELLKRGIADVVTSAQDVAELLDRQDHTRGTTGHTELGQHREPPSTRPERSGPAL